MKTTSLSRVILCLGVGLVLPVHGIVWHRAPPRVSAEPRGVLSGQRLFLGPGRRESSKVPTLAASADVSVPPKDELTTRLQTSQLLWRAGWTSWWIQTVLTVVAGVTLLFARTFAAAASNNASVLGQSAGGGLFLAGIGEILSVASCFWTWGFTRVARRLRKAENLSPRLEARLVRRALRSGIVLNLAGMFVTIFGAEQIIGTLVAKVLSFQGIASGPVAGAYVAPTATLQALDIFVVQANTNTLLSHLSSLTITLWLTWATRIAQFPNISSQSQPSQPSEPVATS